MVKKTIEYYDELAKLAEDESLKALVDYIAELEAENIELKERVAMLDVTAVYKSLGEMGYIEQVDRLTARIAELEGLVDELIEAGDWGAKLAINIGALSGDNQYKLAKKRYDKWDALVKDWKEREE